MNEEDGLQTNLDKVRCAIRVLDGLICDGQSVIRNRERRCLLLDLRRLEKRLLETKGVREDARYLLRERGLEVSDGE